MVATLPEPLAQLAAGPIFVVGSPRSGTTWVFDILVAHPDVAGALETWMFTQRLGFGGLFSWGQWNEENQERARVAAGSQVGLAQMVSRAEIIAAVRELSASWLSRLLDPQHRFLVEKSPPHLFAADTIAEVFPEARFVNVVRDGRDVAVSMKAAAGSWNPLWRRMTNDIDAVATQWKTAIETGRALGERYPGRVLEVRYETLKSDPRATYGTLFAFCEIPCDDALLERILSETDFASLYRGGEDQFRRSGRVGDWRQNFGRADALAFHRAAGTELIRSGYETDERWWKRRGR